MSTSPIHRPAPATHSTMRAAPPAEAAEGNAPVPPADAAPPAPEQPPPVRASNAERQAVVDRLHEALGEGRLDLAETDERIAKAYAAPYRRDLPPLLADLPDAGAQPPAPPAWSDLWVLAVWKVRTAVVGPAAAIERPTARQCNQAAVVALAAACWLVFCMFLGAAVVGG